MKEGLHITRRRISLPARLCLSLLTPTLLALALCSLLIFSCDNDPGTKGATTYTVSFETDGDSVIDEQTITSGGKVSQPSNPTKAGYSFVGWYKETELSNLWNFNSDTVTTDTILYAKWKPVSAGNFVVTFNSNGGTIVQDQVIATGGKVTRPANVTKTGAFLGGWYKEAAFDNLWDFTSETVTQALTLYAKWLTAAPSTVRVTFNPDNGSPITFVTINYNTSLPATYFGTGTNTPSDKTGYRFIGWKNGTTDVTANTRFTQDADLVAQWAWQVTVKFQLGDIEGTPVTNAGEPPADIVIDNNTTMGNRCPSPQIGVLPNNDDPYLEWEFAGWYNGEKQYDANVKIIVDESVDIFTLTARWQVKDNNIRPQTPAIHPGRHFMEAYPDATKTVAANVQFEIVGLFSNIQAGGGTLSAIWYRATSEDGDGSVVGTQTAVPEDPHELTLRYTGTEPAAGTFYYWVSVTNTRADATTPDKTSTETTQNRLKLIVTGP